MAVMDLLKATYKKKLGKTVGADWKGIHTVRSLSDAPRHPSARQTADLLAFGQMNKICGYFARASVYKIQNFNAHQSITNNFASLAKVCLWSQKFNPISFYTAKGINSGWNIRSISRQGQALMVTMGWAGATAWPGRYDALGLFIAFSLEDGGVGSVYEGGGSKYVYIPINGYKAHPIWVWMITIVKSNSGWKLQWTDCSNGALATDTPIEGAYSLIAPAGGATPPPLVP